MKDGSASIPACQRLKNAKVRRMFNLKFNYAR